MQPVMCLPDLSLAIFQCKQQDRRSTARIIDTKYSPSESAETGKNFDKHSITTTDAWCHVDHTHKSFKLYDLDLDLG